MAFELLAVCVVEKRLAGWLLTRSSWNEVEQAYMALICSDVRSKECYDEVKVGKVCCCWKVERRRRRQQDEGIAAALDFDGLNPMRLYKGMSHERCSQLQ